MKVGSGTLPARWAALTVCLVLTLAIVSLGCGGSGSSNLVELQRLKSGMTDVVVLTPPGGLKNGKNDFVIEFRSGGVLTDVGQVRASANMPMPGMPMFSSIDVQRGDAPGRYRASADFSMSGAWRTTIEWAGPD